MKKKRGIMLDLFVISRVRRKIIVVFAKYPDFKTHVRVCIAWRGSVQHRQAFQLQARDDEAAAAGFPFPQLVSECGLVRPFRVDAVGAVFHREHLRL